jgi:Leucine-rich repeat (LRR) protein
LPEPDPGACVLFCDALRFDAGKRLQTLLDQQGLNTEMTWRMAALPPVTPTAKPAVSPVADRIAGNGKQDLIPVVRESGANVTAATLRNLLSSAGYQILADDELGDPAGRAWTEFGAIDVYGHEHGWKIAHHLRHELERLAERVQALLQHGWRRALIVTDHGWLMLPGGLPKADLPLHLTHLRKLSIVNNRLDGTIPAELGNLPIIETIDLTDNRLDGPIPGELGNLDTLVTLDLDDNQITGTIPISLSLMDTLENLRLNTNQLEGTIPPELGNMASLQRLLLNNNQLTGTIPVSLSLLADLTTLKLSNNQLTGSIPPELGDLSELHNLILSHNQLTGTIPVELGNLGALYSLELEYNELDGTIPPELGDLSELRNLYLYHNNITGTLPTELGQLTNLERLWVDYLTVEGAPPDTLGNLSNALSFRFDNSDMAGLLPMSFTGIPHLNELWYDNSGLCEPDNDDFQAWRDSLNYVRGDGVCDINPGIALTTTAVATDVVLSWTDVGGGVSKYDIHRDTSPYFTPAVSSVLSTVVTIPGAQMTFTDTTAIDGSNTNYYYEIIGLDPGDVEVIHTKQMGLFNYELFPGTP